MGHIEATRFIDASPERVFSVITDNARRGDWLTIHAGWIAEPPTEVVAGSTLVEKVVMLGMANKIEWTVDELEAPRTVVNSGTGMAGVKVRFEFNVAPEGDGSQVSINGDFSGSLIVGALGKAVEKDGIKNLDESLSKLEELAKV